MAGFRPLDFLSERAVCPYAIGGRFLWLFGHMTPNSGSLLSPTVTEEEIEGQASKRGA